MLPGSVRGLSYLVTVTLASLGSASARTALTGDNDIGRATFSVPEFPQPGTKSSYGY